MLESREFNHETFIKIIRRGTLLISHGYFTGINFIQSEEPLPQESIIVHFLHKLPSHIDHVRSRLSSPSLVIPRWTFYQLRPGYFDKTTFDEEYKEALFFDESFNPLEREVAKSVKLGITVANQELDLLVPLEEASLQTIVEAIQEADATGPHQWQDPVIIVRSAQTLLPLPGFVPPGAYASLKRVREEFYTILLDQEHRAAFDSYLKRSHRTSPTAAHEDVAFEPCQVNLEFLEYMSRIIMPLSPL